MNRIPTTLRKKCSLFTTKAIIDACRPWEHLDEFPAVAEASKELQEKTRAKWKEIL